MWLQQERVPGGLGTQTMAGGDKVFYTTGRLTSEMVIKSAQMGVPVVVSRSGMTQMGLEVAQRVGLCAIGRATHKRFLCFTHPQRLVLDAIPEPLAAAA
jgi:FdhD protein